MKRLIVFLTVAAGFSQNADDIAKHKGWMDQAQELKDDLKDALDSKAWQKAALQAEELAKLGAREEAYWTRAKQADAVQLAKQNLDASRRIRAAAKSGNADVALQAYSELEATCRQCHDLHPEKRRIQSQ